MSRKIEDYMLPKGWSSEKEFSISYSEEFPDGLFEGFSIGTGSDSDVHMDTVEAVLCAAIGQLMDRVDERREYVKYVRDNPDEFNTVAMGE